MRSLTLDGPDRYRALARSSPWRWRSVHVRQDHGGFCDEPVEAWIRRPGDMRVETGGEVHVVREPPMTVARYTTDGRGGEVALPTAAEVVPVLDDAGLVSVRPSDAVVAYDDPMWQSYDWVAMLDPRELADGSAYRSPDGAEREPVQVDPEPYPDLDWPTWVTEPGVELSDLRETTREGRRTWWATAVPLETYEPRCGCCPLMSCEIAARHEAEGGGPAPEDLPALATTFEVALDLETGICVRVRPVDGGPGGFSLRVLSVDEDYPDAMFRASRGTARWLSGRGR